MSRAVGTVVIALVASSAAAQKRLGVSRASTVNGNLADFFGPDSYPPEAIRNREQGRTVAKLQIAPDGHVTTCTIDGSSGSAALDSATCRIAQAKATFSPARDERGRPVASTYTLPVRWVLPEPTASPFVDFTSIARALIADDGRILSCVEEENGLVSPHESSGCQILRLIPADIALTLRGKRPGTYDVIFQQSVRIGKQAGLSAMPPGHWQAVSTRRTEISIGPDGRVVDCEPIEISGLATRPPGMCTSDATIFVPATDGKPRNATISITLYTRTD